MFLKKRSIASCITLATALLSLITGIFLSGCSKCQNSSNSNPTVHDTTKMYFWSTPEYLQVEQGFKYSHKEAIDHLYRYMASKNDLSFDELSTNGCGYAHYIIVDDEYVFSAPHKIQGINLNGYRVNGFTGEVRSVYGAVMTPAEQTREFGKVYNAFLKL